MWPCNTRLQQIGKAKGGLCASAGFIFAGVTYLLLLASDSAFRDRLAAFSWRRRASGAASKSRAAKLWSTECLGCTTPGAAEHTDAVGNDETVQLQPLFSAAPGGHSVPLAQARSQQCLAPRTTCAAQVMRSSASLQCKALCVKEASRDCWDDEMRLLRLFEAPIHVGAQAFGQACCWSDFRASGWSLQWWRTDYP